MAIPKFYSVSDITGILVADRDVNGIYFLRTANGFKAYRVANTVGKEWIEEDLTDYEKVANKVINLSSPSNTTYPSTKAVSDALLLKEDYKIGYYNYNNGYFVQTNIPQTTDKMIELYVEGNSYNNLAPISTRIQAYNYQGSQQFIRTFAIAEGLLFNINIFYYNNFVCFWMSPSNSFNTLRFTLRTSSGGSETLYNITSVSNAAIPSTGVTGNVLITTQQGWNSGNDGIGSGLDADLLDGQQGSYYLNFGNLTNKPTTLSGYGITDGLVSLSGDQRIFGVKTFATNLTLSTPTSGLPTPGVKSGSFALTVFDLYGLYTGVSDNGNTWIQSMRQDGSSSIYNILLNPVGGKVGIGTSSPAQALDVSGNVIATSFIKSGGTSSQFLKADGSVDSSSYLTSVPAQSFASLTGKPTTVSGYGITDVYTKTQIDTTLATGLMYGGSIPSGADLNSYQTTGWYLQSSGAAADAGSNYPTTFSAGKLEVIFNSANGFGFQTFHTYGVTNKIYFRTFYSGSWSSWKLTVDTSILSTVATSGSYNDLSSKPTIPTTTSQLTNNSGFITSVPAQSFASLTGKPTTLSGYGITDFNSLGDARWSLLSHTHTFASITSKPTTLSGFGITDAYPLSGNPSGFLTSVPAQSFSSLTGKPTTISGYGITDAYTKTSVDSGLASKANLASPTFTGTVILPSTTSIGSITSTELGYVNGVTSAIQTQLNGKAPLTGSGASGTWGISITGNSSTATRGNLLYIGDTRATNPLPTTFSKGLVGDFKTNSVDGLNDGGGYHGVLTIRQYDDFSGGNVHQLGFTDNGNLWHRMGNSTAWDATWKQLAYTSSDITGNAATATNASTLNGLALATGVNNVANQVVRTDASGYLNTGWINTVSGTATGTLARVYCSQDGYLRYLSPANFITSAGIAPVASPAFTGVPTAPTAGYGTNNTQIANTAFVMDAIHKTSINATTSSMTIGLSDVGDVIEAISTSSIVITIPANSSIPFLVGSQITIIRYGTGQVSFAGASGVTINSADSALKLRVQYSSATIIKTETDTWTLIGDITN